jgi:hypothetical protein
LIERVPSVPWNYLFSSGNPLDDSEADAVEALWSGSDTAAAASSDSGEPSAASFPAEVQEDATNLLRRLIGVPIHTVRGHPNRILGIAPPNVLVATDRAPDGRLVPIQQVQDALDTLRGEGSIVIDPENLGYRSSFVGAVLLTLPGARVYGSPPIFTLTGFGSSERSDAGEHVVTYEGDLTHLLLVAQRGEQAVLRRRLFGAQEYGTCALCGETYPVRFLYAAHIKRRSICSESERRDLTSIAMPACAFGCDALFEAGFLSVGADGLIVTSGRDADGALGEYLKTLAGRECLASTSSSQRYFEWHRHNIFRG